MRAAGAEEIKRVNARYHDISAAGYDAKWSIRFDRESHATVVGKLRRALGEEPGPYERSLEIGAGTGYFTLNLLAAGTVREAVATDISQGMLDALRERAAELKLSVETRHAEAARLPFPDDAFDLVVGHAVLHHLPDLDAAFREFRRVLRPGGAVVFCGEPSRHGDRLAAIPKRAALAVAPAWRLLMRASERRNGGGPGENGADTERHGLEALVDVHSFTPADLVRLVRRAGLEHPRVRGEELAANWFGWVNRTLEESAEPHEVPVAWRWYAYGGYLALRAVDRRLLEPRLPPFAFYNLVMSARVPGS